MVDFQALMACHELAASVSIRNDGIILGVYDHDARLARDVPETFEGFPVRGKLVTESPRHPKAASRGYSLVEDEADAKRLSDALGRLHGTFFEFPNVIGVGGGYKVVRGFVHFDRPCIQVYVSHKVPLPELKGGEVLPSSISAFGPEAGVEVDVTEASWTPLDVRRCPFDMFPGLDEVCDLERVGGNDAHLCIGAFLGARHGSTFKLGTLGCFAQRQSDGALGCLTSGHLFARDNSEDWAADRDCSKRSIRTIINLVPGRELCKGGISFRQSDGSSSKHEHQLFDYAFVPIDGEFQIDAKTLGTSKEVKALFPPTEQNPEFTRITLSPEDFLSRETLRVVKVGAKTGFSPGVVSRVVLYEQPGYYRYQVHRFGSWIVARSGDSGSIIVSPQGDALGMLVKGCGVTVDEFCLAIPMHEVQDALGVHLV